MEGGMQKWPLVVTQILDYANRWHGEQQVVTKTIEGDTHVSNYSDLHRRSRLCALALRSLGIRQGSIAATLAWNTTRHMECWYGIAGLGAVCHTLNPRLSDQDLIYIINDAKDTVLLSDHSFVATLERVLPNCPSVKAVVLLTDEQHMPRSSSLPGLLCYDTLLQAETPGLPNFSWTPVHEDTACGLCYTSGTTGRPKGVLYSHRSNYLHALVTTQADALALTAASSVLMVVPMFHANSWGLVYAAPMVGAKLVLPGPHLDGGAVYQQMEDTRVTTTAGVPTVWMNLLQFMEGKGLKGFRSLKKLVIGGAAPPRSMIEAFEERHGVEVLHMWGMTELSPLGSLGTLKGASPPLACPKALDVKVKQGRPHAMCDMRIVDDAGKELPWDGETMGNLQVRGPIVVQQYHNIPSSKPTCTSDSWFDTGDVATIDPQGHMKITDRSKDVIKSGGEWISSIEMENLAMSVQGVAEAAVIGIPDKKWGERPLLVIVPRQPPGGDSLKQAVLQKLSSAMAKWCVPEDVAFVKEIPHTATGKISKLTLRKQFESYNHVSNRITSKL